jgi:hypothetical protein
MNKADLYHFINDRILYDFREQPKVDWDRERQRLFIADWLITRRSFFPDTLVIHLDERVEQELRAAGLTVITKGEDVCKISKKNQD